MSDLLRTSVAADLGSLAELVSGEPASPPLEPGALIGEHFEIEAAIGAGGMGAVYRARDRRLDRRVALKLGLRGTDLARARREAVALARLAHPNVVTIHEVGEHAGAPFVAMELCTGGTARAWVRDRPWREVLALYLAAGRGLAAAHAAGLVHRDVKPDNILIGGDGRARIGDFGLAREAPIAGAGDGRVRLPDDAVVTRTTTTGPGGDATATGAVVGTPRYMAPEQWAGAAVDARADQFAFAVALLEALAGADPFPADPAQRAAAIAAGRITPGPRPVPRRVVQVLARALRPAPGDRWPDMAALLAALGSAARRRWPYAVAAVAAVAAASLVGWSVTRPAAAPAAPDPCVALAPTTAWRPTQRAAFVAAHPRAPVTAAWTADVLDATAARWAVQRLTVCTVAPHDPAWSQEVLGKAVDCLRRVRDQLDAAAATGDVAPGALVAATALVPTTDCARREAVALVHGTVDAAAGARQDEVERQVAAAQAALEAGRPEDARRLVAQAAATAAAATPTAVGMAAQLQGRIELQAGARDEAIAHLRRAYFAFRSVSDGRQTFSVAFQLAQAYAAAGKLDDAAEWLDHARAEGARIEVEPSSVAMMAQIEALIARARGQAAAAVDANARGIAALEAARDPVMLPNLIRALATQATLLAEAGRLDESIAVARATLARQEALFGPDHPEQLVTLGNIGLGYADQGKLPEALPWLTRARDLADRLYDRDALERAVPLINLGQALAKADPAAAVPVLAEALRVVELRLGADAEDATDLRGQLAAARAAAGGR